ncbi:hypothetical protein IWX49DRAFT_352591 [Phyllosticta citricarpa]
MRYSFYYHGAFFFFFFFLLLLSSPFDSKSHLFPNVRSTFELSWTNLESFAIASSQPLFAPRTIFLGGGARAALGHSRSSETRDGRTSRSRPTDCARPRTRLVLKTSFLMTRSWSVLCFFCTWHGDKGTSDGCNGRGTPARLWS